MRRHRSSSRSQLNQRSTTRSSRAFSSLPARSRQSSVSCSSSSTRSFRPSSSAARTTAAHSIPVRYQSPAPTHSPVVSRFVRAARHDQFSLHSALQGWRIVDCAWLESGHGPAQRVSPSDARKREQLLAELVFWLVEGFLTPLLRVRAAARCASLTEVDDVLRDRRQRVPLPNALLPPG